MPSLLKETCLARTCDSSSSRILLRRDYDTIFSFAAERAHIYALLFKHSIATSRCRKTEWLLCGEHASSVLVARFSLVLDAEVESSRLLNVYSTDTIWRMGNKCFFPLSLYAVAKYYYWSCLNVRTRYNSPRRLKASALSI